MAVSESEGDGVAADDLPSGGADAMDLRSVIAAYFLSEQVAFAGSLGARGPGAEALHGVVVFAAITPSDRDFVSNGLDVGGAKHKVCGSRLSDTAGQRSGALKILGNWSSVHKIIGSGFLIRL